MRIPHSCPMIDDVIDSVAQTRSYLEEIESTIEACVEMNNFDGIAAEIADLVAKASNQLEAIHVSGYGSAASHMEQIRDVNSRLRDYASDLEDKVERVEFNAEREESELRARIADLEDENNDLRRLLADRDY